ncbi:MAG: hypothetical protein QOK28_3119 [Actinomycetota bacterium]
MGEIAYRLYVLAYGSVVGLAFLGDVRGNHAAAATIAPRTTALAGAALVALIVIAGSLGRRVVALRPSPADVQLALLSPSPRDDTLRSTIGVAASVAAVAAGVAAIVFMFVATPQFSGLSVGVELAYVAFGAAIGLLVYALHLVVAERRSLVPLGLIAGAVIVLCGVDVLSESARSPATLAVRSLRCGASPIAILATVGIGSALLWRARANAEDIETEMISRGGDLADHAAVALFGNDVRTLLILQRSMGSQPWRRRPLVHFPSAVAQRFPVLARTLRNIARWRGYRWLVMLSLTGALCGLLRVQPASARTTVLSAMCLWLLGLVSCESIAQEHDRADRLSLLPMERSIEFRQFAAAWSIEFVWLTAALLATRSRASSILTLTCLAAACTTAATVAAAVTFRRVWKPVTSLEWMASPAPGAEIVITVLWPALVAFICLSGLLRGATGALLLPSSVLVTIGYLLWVAKG